MTSSMLAQQKTTAIGRLIAERRERLGMTQEQLAKSVHVARSSIANIENGKTGRPSVDLVNALARLLQLPVTDLLRAIGYAVDQDARILRRFQAFERLREQIDALLGEDDESTDESPHTT